MEKLRQLLSGFFTSVCNIGKTNMEKDCAFANLKDKYTFKFKELVPDRSIGHYLQICLA
jgi:hypothetical protein